MRKLRAWLVRFTGFFNKQRKDRELAQEVESHLQMHLEDNIRTGMSPEEARRQAIIKFGGVESIKEMCRDQRGVRWIEDFVKDVGFGARMLRKNPGFAAVAVFTLALGIGANTVIFSVANTVLLKPLPYRDPESLVYVWSAEKARGIPESPASIQDFQDWQRQNGVFAGMAAMFNTSFNLTSVSEPVRLDGLTVSCNFFELLGAQPAIGRTFLPEEEQAGKNHVVVLSHALWMESFGGSPGIVGKTITLNMKPFTVIGVMPAQFSSPRPADKFWIPMTHLNVSRGDRFARVLARFKPGVTLAGATANMEIIARRLETEYPENEGVTTYLVPVLEQITGRVHRALMVLVGAVGFVLLIACANLANLLLARSAGREKEFAVRKALGAGRRRLIRQLLTESVLLSFLGAVLGLLLAYWGIGLVRTMAPQELPRVQEISVGYGMLLFTIGLSVVTGVAFGLVPALQASRGHFTLALKESVRSAGSGPRGRRVRDLLVVAEMSVALVLLTGAGLLMSSFLRLRSVNPGFNPDQVLTCKISLPLSRYEKDGQIVSFFQQLLGRIRTLPGVRAAGATMTLPLGGGGNWTGFQVESASEPASREARPVVSFTQVTPGYFTAMAVPVLKGRGFNEADDEHSPKVAIINDTIARRFFGDGDPIGKRIRLGPGKEEPWLNVVGVIGNAHIESLTDPLFPQVYAPQSQGVQGGAAGDMALAVRTSGDPLALAAVVREQVHALDKDQPVANMRALGSVVRESLAQHRFNTTLFGAFAMLAVLLAAVGIYGVMAHGATQLTREIGIRMALGAQRWHVLSLMIGSGAKLTLMGVGIGLAASLALTRVLAKLLYEVKPTDPLTFAGASALLILASLLACWLPARRAAQLDPMVALRQE